MSIDSALNGLLRAGDRRRRHRRRSRWRWSSCSTVWTLDQRGGGAARARCNAMPNSASARWRLARRWPVSMAAPARRSRMPARRRSSPIRKAPPRAIAYTAARLTLLADAHEFAKRDGAICDALRGRAARARARPLRPCRPCAGDPRRLHRRAVRGLRLAARHQPCSRPT